MARTHCLVDSWRVRSSGEKLHVLFAASEAAPVARVGGLAEAAAGLIRELRRTDSIELTVVLPDYGDVELDDETTRELSVPNWVRSATVRAGIAPELGAVELVSVPGIARSHPYVDKAGLGWADNDRRFFGFSAAVAAIAEEAKVDLIHLNDWHTAVTLALTDLPSVFTIHTLGYQGHAGLEWVDAIGGPRISAYDRGDHFNPLAGAVALADAVITVSPTYASEIRSPHRGEGLHVDLLERGDDLVGICNGIDVELWDPTTDPHLVANYGRSTLEQKSKTITELRTLAGWPDDGEFIVGMVTRMVDQKGIDLMLGLMPFLSGIGVRLFLLGSGDERLSRWARELSLENPDRLHFVESYDVALAHQIFAGADFLAMPSRFEPCGLAQMQAMRYGTIPIVTPVGGLRDSVVDADADTENGNGFVAKTVDATGMLDALHRAVAAARVKRRRSLIQRQGMARDWSWEEPTEQYIKQYRRVVTERAEASPTT